MILRCDDVVWSRVIVAFKCADNSFLNNCRRSRFNLRLLLSRVVAVSFFGALFEMADIGGEVLLLHRSQLGQLLFLI
jgi:hypothetical protein